MPVNRLGIERNRKTLPNEIMVWDLETVPDLEGYARANGLNRQVPPEEIRTAIRPDFPELIYHSIVCIGALVEQAGGATATRCRLWERRTSGSARRRS